MLGLGGPVQGPRVPSVPVSLGLQGPWTTLPPDSRRRLEATPGKETGLQPRVTRMEGPHFWSEVVEGEIMPLGPKFLGPLL